MARNRSQSARTDAERARARAERARKRAEREGEPAPADLEPPAMEVEPAPADLERSPMEVEPAPADLAPPAMEVEPAPADLAPPAMEVEPAPADLERSPREVEPAPTDAELAPTEFEPALAPWPGELVGPDEVESSSTQAGTSPVLADAAPAALESPPTEVEHMPTQIQSDAATVEHELAPDQGDATTLEPAANEPQAQPPDSPSTSTTPPTPPPTRPPTPPPTRPQTPPSPPPSSASPPTPAPATTLPPAPPAPAALRATARHRRSPWRRVLAVVALVVVAAAVWLVLDRPGSAKHARTVAAPVVVRVVIPEGYTRAQIAARAREDGLTGSYLAASKRSSSLDPSSYGAPRDTPSLEGFLFPATYDMYRGTPASRLVSEQLVAFHERFSADFVRRAKALHVTPYQLLTIASIIEREAQLPADRAKVAAVIYNRLHAGMPLAVDATLRYALGDFTRPLTKAQLALSSPYNTRLHHGLSPTPISNPGMAAIDAAAHPDHVSYLYYVAGADGCGEEVFSTSIATFERDAAAYREALRRNGGKVPTCRKKP